MPGDQTVVPLHLYLAFVAATLVLCIVPGPVVTYLVATGIRQGSRDALIALGGTSSALCVHMVLVVAGLAPLLAALGPWAELLKLIGAAYLVWLGVQTWRAQIEGDGAEAARAAPMRPSTLYRRGFVISVTNPKVLAFYAAFFPQFIDPAQPSSPQLVLLALSFVMIGALSDGTYALAAGRLAPYLKSTRAQIIRNRITGVVLAATGIGLAVARR
jgi:threonine/homoserine/homoserine lactone efflux protein